MSTWYVKTFLNGELYRVQGGSQAKEEFLSIARSLLFAKRTYGFHDSKSFFAGMSDHSISTMFPVENILFNLSSGDLIEYQLYRKNTSGKVRFAKVAFDIIAIGREGSLRYVEVEQDTVEVSSRNQEIYAALGNRANLTALTLPIRSNSETIEHIKNLALVGNVYLTCEDNNVDISKVLNVSLVDGMLQIRVLEDSSECLKSYRANEWSLWFEDPVYFKLAGVKYNLWQMNEMFRPMQSTHARRFVKHLYSTIQTQ